MITDPLTRTVDTSKIAILPISKNVAKDIIVKNHYSHTWTMCSVALGVLYTDTSKFYGDTEKIIGTIIFGSPIGRRVIKSISPLLNNGEVLELTRLWIEDGYGTNIESYVIGQSFKYIRHNLPHIKSIISYSDPEQGHTGTIYQATNAIYQGDKTRIVTAWWYRFPDSDEWIHPRTVVSKFGSVAPKNLLRVYPEGYEIKELKRKHRYVWIICKEPDRSLILNSLKHTSVEYPKKKEIEKEHIIKVSL